MQSSEYIEAYQQIKQNDKLPKSVKTEKEKALQNLMSRGLPDRGDERYRYLDFDSVFNMPFQKVLEKPDVKTDLNSFFQCEVEGFDTELILLSNGWYYQDTTDEADIPDSVIICSMQE